MWWRRLASIDDLLILLKRVIGHISGELQARFSHDQQDVMRVVSAFCPSSPNFLNMDLLNKVSERYGFTISCSEVDVVKAFLQKSNLKESTLFDIFDSVDKDIFPGVHHMLRILLTIPQTSVTVERLFSSVKRIKTRMRSKMNTSRLSALALLSFEKDIARNLNRCSVIQRFRRMKNRRLLWSLVVMQSLICFRLTWSAYSQNLSKIEHQRFEFFIVKYERIIFIHDIWSSCYCFLIVIGQ